MSEITWQSYLQAMREVVEDMGADYVYPTNAPGYMTHYDNEPAEGVCRYRAEDGTPACIHGRVLDKLGVEYSPRWEDTGIYHVLNSLGLDFNADNAALSDAAVEAQIKQDGGRTWGEALDAFENELARHGLPIHEVE